MVERHVGQVVGCGVRGRMPNREEAGMSSCWIVDESAITCCATSGFCPRSRRALSVGLGVARLTLIGAPR